MLVCDAAHPRPAHVCKGDAAISAALPKKIGKNGDLTVYHFRGHDSLSLAVFNGIILLGATDQTGTGYRVPLAFESDIRSEWGHIDTF
jgi:hypothetical protein